MMIISGSGELGVQVMKQMIPTFKRSLPKVPQKFWTDFIAQVDPNELVEMCIPSYDKHLTHAEVKELINFYKTPVGQKLIRVQPQIMQECMIAGQKWGRELGRKIGKQLAEQGYK